MKRRGAMLTLAGVFLSAPLLLFSCSQSTMTMPEFKALKPFNGRVTKVERVDWESGYHLHSASGPDFRITVVKPDGSTITIRRIHTQVFQADRLRKLVDKAQCSLPEEIAQCEDRIGKDSY
jgi:hypothetical protein